MEARRRGRLLQGLMYTLLTLNRWTRLTFRLATGADALAHSNSQNYCIRQLTSVKTLIHVHVLVITLLVHSAIYYNISPSSQHFRYHRRGLCCPKSCSLAVSLRRPPPSQRSVFSTGMGTYY